MSGKRLLGATALALITLVASSTGAGAPTAPVVAASETARATSPDATTPVTRRTAGADAISLSRSQLLINQRISQAAIRRLNRVFTELMSCVRPAPGPGGEPGSVRLSVRQLRINQRISQAAIRRAGSIEARLEGRPDPPPPARDPDALTLSATQLRINQRIAQAAVRRANALTQRAPELPCPRPAFTMSPDDLVGFAITPRRIRVIIVNKGDTEVGTVLNLILPAVPPDPGEEHGPIVPMPPPLPNDVVGGEGIVVDGIFFPFLVSIEPSEQ